MNYNFFPNFNPSTNDALQGYEILRLNNRIDFLQLIKSEILLADFAYLKGAKLFFGDRSSQVNNFFKQYLFDKLITTKFNKAILSSIYQQKKLVYPIPPLWQCILINNGIKVSKFWCNLIWFSFVISHWIWGCVNIFRIIARSLKLLVKKNDVFSRPHSFFFDINESSLFIDRNSNDPRTILSWYIKQKGDLQMNLFHQVKFRKDTLTIDKYTISYNPYFLSPFTSIKDLLKFVIWSIKAVIVSSFSLLTGKWLYCIFLKESTFLSQVNYLKHNLLASEYFFNNSTPYYRPLWTYGAEKRGSKILFYFYSVPSFIQYTIVPINKRIVENWILLSWSTYFVWNDHQEKFVRKFSTNNPEIIITGPILLTDSSLEIETVAGNCISVFDVQPYKDEYYKILGFAEEYLMADVAIKFLDDIVAVCAENDLKILHKRKKRDKGNYIHSRYNHFLSSCELNKQVITIDPETSPLKIIEKSTAVISMPFTSTAFLGVFSNKPSIFYDPTGLISKNNPATDSIMVINGIEELRIWIKSIVI